MQFTHETASEVVEKLNFEKLNGLVPVVVQDYVNNQVLMVGFANKEAVIKTLTTGLSHFFSRTRNRIWLKGESSGHKQYVKSVYVDCDADTLLLKVDQKVAACHMGYRTCFYREVSEKGEFIIKEKKVFEPDEIYG